MRGTARFQSLGQDNRTVLKEAQESLLEEEAVSPAEAEFRGVPSGQQPSGVFFNAAVGGGVPESRAEPEEEKGYLRGKVMGVNELPEITHLLRAEGAAIEAVLVGVLIAGLAATFTFHKGILARMFWER